MVEFRATREANLSISAKWLHRSGEDRFNEQRDKSAKCPNQTEADHSHYVDEQRRADSHLGRVHRL